MWLYEGKQVSNLESIPPGTWGFVYVVTHMPTGKKYVGKKVLYTHRKKKLTKKQLAEWNKPGRKPTHEVVVKESDWQTYVGSSKEMISLLKQGTLADFNREILQFCNTKKQLTYYELKYQLTLAVLEKNEYVNDNVLGKFFRKDV